MNTLQLQLAVFMLLLTSNVASHAQEASQVKEKVLAALTTIENYPAGVVKGSAIYAGLAVGEGHLHFRGEQYWLETNSLPVNKEADRRRIVATYQIMGAGDLIPTAEFDGFRFLEFRPYTLTLIVRPTTKLPPAFTRCALVPKYWLKMGANPRQQFKDIAESEAFETKVEQLAPGRWRLSHSNMGADLPGGNAGLDIRERSITVDEKFDFLVTEYFAKGSQGVLEGTLQWEKQDGNWYAKKGKQTISAKPWAEWTIDEISFDPEKVRTSFGDLEDTVPFGTRIIREDERQREIVRDHKGGSAGKIEFERREKEWAKRLQEGF